ncbi:hypothetical protein Tcan_00801, partial [Toxocara canis]
MIDHFAANFERFKATPPTLYAHPHIANSCDRSHHLCTSLRSSYNQPPHLVRTDRSQGSSVFRSKGHLLSPNRIFVTNTEFVVPHKPARRLCAMVFSKRSLKWFFFTILCAMLLDRLLRGTE